MRYVAPYKSDKLLRLLFYTVYGCLLLYFGRELFIPLSFAALVSFILYPVCMWLERRGIGRLPAILMSLVLTLVFGSTLVLLMMQQLMLFLTEWPAIKPKLSALAGNVSRYFTDYYNLSSNTQQKWINNAIDQSANYAVSFLEQLVSASVSWLVLLILVPVFTALILYYRGLLVKVIYLVFPEERKQDMRKLLLLTIDAYYSFIKGMAIVYLVVGVLNSVGLLVIGVPHAIFFGFTAAVLTFIPYLGIMVGSLLPVAMAWITYNSVWYPLGVLVVFAIVQYLEANVIFPLAVSNRLKINALATLVVIVAGGILWGVPGMILFVPFLAIIKLVADRHPRMKIISTITGN